MSRFESPLTANSTTRRSPGVSASAPRGGRAPEARTGAAQLGRGRLGEPRRAARQGQLACPLKVGPREAALPAPAEQRAARDEGARAFYRRVGVLERADRLGEQRLAVVVVARCHGRGLQRDTERARGRRRARELEFLAGAPGALAGPPEPRQGGRRRGAPGI